MSQHANLDDGGEPLKCSRQGHRSQSVVIRRNRPEYVVVRSNCSLSLVPTPDYRVVANITFANQFRAVFTGIILNSIVSKSDIDFTVTVFIPHCSIVDGVISAITTGNPRGESLVTLRAHPTGVLWDVRCNNLFRSPPFGRF